MIVKNARLPVVPYDTSTLRHSVHWSFFEQTACKISQMIGNKDHFNETVCKPTLKVISAGYCVFYNNSVWCDNLKEFSGRPHAQNSSSNEGVHYFWQPNKTFVEYHLTFFFFLWLQLEHTGILYSTKCVWIFTCIFYSSNPFLMKFIFHLSSRI